MTSSAKTPDEYIASLPDDRRESLSKIRTAILSVLPHGYAETMQYGMITYVVPHSRYPAGYHCDPKQAVPYVSLASQKNHMALYLSGVGEGPHSEQFRERYLATGKKLDKGVSCVRFKRLEDVALDVIVDHIAATPVEEFLSRYEATIPPSKKKPKGQAA